MRILTFQNVSEYIFYDKKIHQLLPEYSSTFQKWTLGVRTGLNSMVKDAQLEFLNNVTPDALNRLSKFWNLPVTVETLDSGLSKNIIIPITQLEEYLNSINQQWNVVISLNNDMCYLSLWR